eukprot:g3092.t1
MGSPIVSTFVEFFTSKEIAKLYLILKVSRHAVSKLLTRDTILPQILSSRTFLELRAGSNCGLKSLSEFPRLGVLNVSACKDISDDGLLFLAKGCPNLTSLNLWRVNKITNDGVKALAERLNLKTIVLSSCENVGDKGLLSLAMHCPGLENLYVSNCSLLSDKGLIAIAENCCKMKSIYLSNTNASSLSLKALGKNCHQLQTIYLNGSRVDDTGCIALAKCSELEEIALDFCEDVTDNGVQAFAHCCKRLRSLSLDSCDQVSDDLRNSLKGRGIAVSEEKF